MKNPVCGIIPVLINSIEAAHSGHIFLYRGWEVSTEGNPLAHAIIRGYENNSGETKPNYHFEYVQRLFDVYMKKDFRYLAVIIDTNHSNLGKRPLEQPRIVNEVINNCLYHSELRKIFRGFMIESYTEDGSQKIGEHIYGKSITAPCFGWEKTERLIYDIASKW